MKRTRGSDSLSVKQLNRVHQRILELLHETPSHDDQTIHYVAPNGAEEWDSRDHVSLIKSQAYAPFSTIFGFSDLTYLQLNDQVVPEWQDVNSPPETLHALKSMLKAIPEAEDLNEVRTNPAFRLCAVGSDHYNNRAALELQASISKQIMAELPTLLELPTRTR